MTDVNQTPTCEDCRQIGLDVHEWLLDLERDVGAARVAAFLREFGGRQFEVPKQGGARHDAVTAWIRAEIGHGRITIPRGPTLNSSGPSATG